MGMYIATNVASMTAQNKLASSQTNLANTFTRLSSGLRINSAKDDAAGLGIAEALSAQTRSYAVAERNTNNAISMAQTADGAAAQIHNMLGRMRELAVQASNGDLSSTDYTNLNTEFQAIVSEIDRVANVTRFNGVNLLAGTATTINFQVGIGTTSNDRVGVSFGGVSTSSLGVSGASVSSFTGAQSAISAIDSAIQSLSVTREGFGAAMNRFQVAVSNLQSMRTNMSASLGRIRDADIAEETAALARQQVLAQAGVAVLAQANQAPQLALSLLR